MTLLPGEAIEWQGKPKQGFVTGKQDRYLVPFSLLWCGFAFFWEFTASTRGGPSFFLLFGGVFCLIGLYFVFGRFIHDYLVRRATTYYVTTQRVAIDSGSTTQYFDRERLPSISIEEFGDGTGTIVFGTIQTQGPSLFNSRIPFSYLPSKLGAPAFFRIPQPQDVYKRITGRI